MTNLHCKQTTNITILLHLGKLHKLLFSHCHVTMDKKQTIYTQNKPQNISK